MEVFSCLLFLTYLFVPTYQMWSDESKKFFENCYEDLKGRNIQLPDDVTGMGAPALDICLEKCRTKKVTFMALKVNACFCYERYPLEWTRTDPTNCVNSGCPEGFYCGKGRTVAAYFVCRKGRFGKNCDGRCHCSDLPCRVKDGLCHLGDSSCQKNWLGKACNLSDPCIKYQSFCQNGAKCAHTDVGLAKILWECNCTAGHYGPNCTEACPKNRHGGGCVFNCFCKNDEPCYVSTGVCSSGCKEGYFGKDCSMRDGCISQPCKNGGICIRDEDGFFCDCPHAFSGLTCADPMPNMTVTLNPSNEAKRKEVLDNEKKQMMMEVAKKSVSIIRPSLMGVNFNEDKSLFHTYIEFVVDAIQQYIFKRPVVEDYVEEIDINMGCFKETTHHYKMSDMDGHVEVMIKPMSLQACRDLCRRRKFTFAGAMKGSLCLCGNTYGRHGAVGQRNCDESCGDNDQVRCGGKEHYSLYPVCRFGQFGPECQYGCFCAIFPCKVHSGRCPLDTCRHGWFGTQCNTKFLSWASPHRLYVYIFISLCLYLILVLIITVIINVVRYRHEKKPDYRWFVDRM